MSSVTIRHNFETGHRLPHLGGKCSNLHGHSWWAEVTFTGEPDPFSGIVAEYGQLKLLVRSWIDSNLDHGLMLGPADPLVEVLAKHGKVYQVDPWPTVEQVASHLADVCQLLADEAGLQVYVSRVKLSETSVNAAEVTR